MHYLRRWQRRVRIAVQHDQVSESATVVFYDLMTEEITVKEGNYAEISTQHPETVSVCVKKQGKIPYINEGKKDIYIQNEIIKGMASFKGNNMIIGSDISTDKPKGDVIIDIPPINDSVLNDFEAILDGYIEFRAGTTISDQTQMSVEFNY